MAALGYHRIDGYVNDQPGSRSINTSTRGNGPSQPFVRFDFGYEAGNAEVKRLLGPDDPETEDEWWLHYEPATGRLDLHAWRPVAKRACRLGHMNRPRPLHCGRGAPPPVCAGPRGAGLRARAPR